MTASSQKSARATTLDRAIEGTWLVCAAFVPILIMPDTWMTGFVQVPKVFLLRTCAILLVVLMGIRWANGPGGNGLTVGSGRSWLDLLRAALAAATGYLRTHPIMLAAVGVLAANLLSLLFSPMRTVSLGGVDPGWDGYSLASVASYLVIFVAVATNLRSVVQVRRLLWALTISSLILSAYGTGQYLGFDLFRTEWNPNDRIWLTFGNPTFGASYLLMTIPLTLALWQGWQKRFAPAVHVMLGMALVMPQIGVLAMTLSRGAMISMAFSLAVFVGLSFWLFGLKRAQRPATILAVGVGLVLATSFVPIPGVPRVGSALVERLSTIGASLTVAGGGLSDRYTVWGYSVTAFTSVPWADTDAFPEIPELTARPLRRLVGYGPDMFRYAISYAQSPVEEPVGPGRWQSAHNFLIHAGVELGLLGVVAYLSLVAAISLALYRLLREARAGGIPEPMAYVVIGLAAVLAGRGLEQMTGKAQISDLALSWILAGVVVALTGMRPQAATVTPAEAKVTSRKPAARRESQGRRSGGEGLISRQVVINGAIAMVVMGAIVVWSQTAVGTLRSSLLLGEAIRAGEAGQTDRTGALMERAIAVAPDDVAPRFLLSGALLNGAESELDPALKLSLLRTAYDTIGKVIERNPMEFRARARAAGISVEIMLLDPTFVPTAIRNREVNAALSPSLWKPLEFLGETLFQVGLLDTAQDVLDRAMAQGASNSNYRYYVLYLQARIAIERGDLAEATRIMQDYTNNMHAFRDKMTSRMTWRAQTPSATFSGRKMLHGNNLRSLEYWGARIDPGAAGDGDQAGRHRAGHESFCLDYHA